MDTERLVSVGVACVVVVAIGLSAATLGSSMSTDPSDAIDPDYDMLPVGDDRAGQIEDAAQDLHDRYTGNPAPTGERSERANRDPEGADTRSASESNPGSSESNSGSSNDGNDQQNAPSEGEGTGVVPTESNLQALLFALLALVALAVLVGIAYRYREEIISLLGMMVGAKAPPDEGTETLRPAPENDVQRAWVALLQRAGITRPRTRTPRDCARAAVETGFDAEAVHRLRRAFEDVQYGGESPSGERVRVARESLQSLGEDDE
ncbi:DUF4129 domain-containing protein [Halomicroarcula sp. S1AR25-4]|uniref:DUF4129 domain-containing protein n=1 Tax=Haloarcula sp. S1AR25-4 TaxID=2950538 RepID=UPI002873FBEC|nr:DUF4129 domain-containing protein [Halomicroarcula sp. S1AR25-4]MDS0278486.1 DUF4129 domain-containing protein [Halomicroarcula sp. S1AR25-4]